MLAKYEAPLTVRPMNGVSQSPIDRLFDDVLSHWNFFPAIQNQMKTDLPHYDLKEEGGKLTCEVDLPGVAEKDIEITVQDGHIMITGSRKGTEFKYRFSTGKEYDVDKAEARLANGVLSLVIPSIEKAQPKKIKLLTK